MLAPIWIELAPVAIYETYGSTATVADVTSAAPPSPAKDAADPWQDANRRLYGVNDDLDRVALRPAAMAYRRWLPRPVRNGVHNAIANLDEPRVIVNDVLQGRVNRAGVATLRFAMNSSIGVAGVFDVAREAGWRRHENDFGVTLGRLGVTPGPYIFVPLLGPSTVRGLVGTGVDFVLDPLNWIPYRHANDIAVATNAFDALDSRARIDRDLTDLKRVAVDPYATVRSIYLQSKEAEVQGGMLDVRDLPDFPDAPETPPDSLETPLSARDSR